MIALGAAVGIISVIWYLTQPAPEPPPMDAVRLAASNAINDAVYEINKAEKEGRNAGDARERLAEANAAFERGEYKTALKLAENARDTAKAGVRITPPPANITNLTDNATGNVTGPSNVTTNATRKIVLTTIIPRKPLAAGAVPLLPDDPFGDFDFDSLPLLINAGINEVGGPMEFMTKESSERQRLRREFVNEVKKYNVDYWHYIPLTGEQVEDEHFIAAWLDEPFLQDYFPTPALDDTVRNRIIVTRDVTLAAREYVRYIQRLLDAQKMPSTFRDNIPGTVNTIESTAWYDLKAGAREIRPEIYYLQQIHFFNDYFGLGIPETTENYVRLFAAFGRGASRHFGGRPWGANIFSGLPGVTLQIIEGLYDRGATTFLFWAYREGAALPQDEVIRLAGGVKRYSESHAQTKTNAKLAIIIPDGYHVPQGIYYSPELCSSTDCKGQDGTAKYEELWNMMQLEKGNEADQHLRVLRRFGEAVKDALAGPDEFDILVNDETLRQEELGRYERTVRVE